MSQLVEAPAPTIDPSVIAAGMENFGQFEAEFDNPMLDAMMAMQTEFTGLSLDAPEANAKDALATERGLHALLAPNFAAESLAFAVAASNQQQWNGLQDMLLRHELSKSEKADA